MKFRDIFKKSLLIYFILPLAFLFNAHMSYGQDTDSDGVPDSIDNCITMPNGPTLGSCSLGTCDQLAISCTYSNFMFPVCGVDGTCEYIRESCTSNGDCGTSGYCLMTQVDSYPPQGNGIGDACDCEGNFDCNTGDTDVDGLDRSKFEDNLGRTDCSDVHPCDGDFDCDGDVDSYDDEKFFEDFGRSRFHHPCPTCTSRNWCNYPTDMDYDGILNTEDNCIHIPNGPDAGTCISGNIGNACMGDGDCGTGGVCSKNQEDADNDTVGDVCDNCPVNSNPAQEDNDDDALGDVCDPDDDNDGVCDPGETDPSCTGTDNCPLISNVDQTNNDDDSHGDVCDNCPLDENDDQADPDVDGLGNVCDNCPADYNPLQEDRDNSGIGDTCNAMFDADGDDWEDSYDNCPIVFNPNHLDNDSDGMGNVCDDDMDGDGLLNTVDNCPPAPNPGQEDIDGDGFADACDSENSSALIDRVNNKLMIFDNANHLLYEKECNGIAYCSAVRPSATGWLVKGLSWDHSSWFIWHLNPDLSVRNTMMNMGVGGAAFGGLTNGNFVSAHPTIGGVIVLYTASGSIIASTNAWEEENGWSFDYTGMGDIVGLKNGGFVVPPAGWNSSSYAPYLYFYDNNLNLINKVDITTHNIRLFSLAALSDGGFAAQCANANEEYISDICYFNQVGQLMKKVDITADISLDMRYWLHSLFIGALNDGGVVLANRNNEVWVYHSPGVKYDFSVYGIAEIGALSGNILMLDTDSDQTPDYQDNCPGLVNSDQADNYPPGGNGCGDACECEGNFQGDDVDCDGSDAAIFKVDFGRNSMNRLCKADDPCNGDFSCNGNVDGTDAARFKADFGRSGFSNSCPAKVTKPWCSYP